MLGQRLEPNQRFGAKCSVSWWRPAIEVAGGMAARGRGNGYGIKPCRNGLRAALDDIRRERGDVTARDGPIKGHDSPAGVMAFRA